MKIMGKIKEKVKLTLGQESYFSGQLYKQLQTYADFSDMEQFIFFL